MANRFLNNITINDSYTLPSSDGSADQIIQTDGAGNLTFIDPSVLAVGESEQVHIACKNTSGVAISKGDPVYITGTVGTSFRIQIAAADASNSAKMPAVGLAESDLAHNAEGFVIVSGVLKNLTTDPLSTGDGTPSSNDTVYVKAGGGLTRTKPTGSGNLIQNVGKVGRVSSANSGSLAVSTIMRTNDVPNLTTGKIWVGSSTYTTESGVIHLDETSNRLGVNETSPSSDVHINNGSTSPVLRLSYEPAGGYGGGGSIRFQGGASDYVYGDIGWWNGSNKDADINYSAASRAMNFKVNDRSISTNGYFRFYNDNTEVAEINANGVYGNVFYDQGNTSYYVNPASTGTSLNVAGDARVKSAYISNSSGSVSNKIWFDNGGIYQPGLYFDGNNPKFIINSLVTSIFHDTYHPNADTWTTARTITIGNTGKTVDGSANVSWSLSEIGAAASSHTHSASDITSGTLDLARIPEFLEEKYIYTSNDSNGVYMPMVKGGMYATSASSVTGQILIKIPSYKTSMMQQFYVDIYEYDTGESMTFRISGYNYNDTNATWYNTSVVNLSDDTDRDFTVRFGADTTNGYQYVAIGETNSTWNYPQVNIRDFFGGYATSESDAQGSFEISFVTTTPGSTSQTHTGNFVAGDYNNLKNIPSTFPPSSHNHDSDYVNVTGDTMTGTLTVPNLTIGSGNKIKFANNDYIRYDDANGVGRFHFDADGGTNNASVQAATFVGALSTTGISGSNYNITGVNQLEINDPGEGIVWKSGSSGDIILAVVDDSSDNILRLSGTGAELQVGTNRVLTTADEGSGNGLDADLLDGQQGSYYLDYNNFTNTPTIPSPYTHPTHPGDDINLDTGALTGATVISDLDFNITTDTLGHVTDANATYSTRSLTASDVGAASSSHTHDDRYYTESEMQTFFNRGYISAQSASNLAIGWYTIATNTGNRALGEFQIWDVAGSRHQSVLFNASHHYGTDNSNDITVLANSRFGTDVFRYLRIREGGTYDGAALQVYIDNSTNSVNVAITGANAQSSGWVLKDWIPNATDPGDVDNYSSFTNKCQVDLDNIQNGGIATTGDIFSGGALTQYRNLTTADEGSGNGLDADTLDGQHASAFASSSHNHDGDYVELTGDTMSGPLIIDEASTTDQWLFRVDNNGSNYSGFWSASQDIQLYLRDDAGNVRVQLKPDARSLFYDGLEAANLYDSDNTSYYLNPASTSVLNDVSGTRIWAGYDSGVTNSISCSGWFRSSGSTGWFNASYGGGINMTDSTWVRVYNNKKFYNQNTIESNTAMYAPVFYDRNNTDYRFHGDQANDNVDLRTSGNYSIHVNGAIGGGHRKHNNLESPEMQWSVGGGTDLNWKKLCDIVVNDQTYSGYGAEIEITDFSGNFGNATYNGGELFKGALSIYHWGGSGTTPEIAYANIPYEMRSHVRWYKINETGQNRYQLQVKSPANYRELYVKVKPGIRNGVAEIISYANNTDGATSGGTAYASIQNADFNHEFAGGIWTNSSRNIGWKTIYGNLYLSTYYGSITTSTSVYIGGPTGNGQDLYCDDLRSNKVFDRAATAYYFEGGNTGDSIRVAGDVVAYYSSDKRLKDNIKPIENALDKVNAISGVTFEWNEKSHKTTGRKDVGVVAQEVEEVFPEIVETRTNGFKAVDYQKLTAVLIESVKELTAKVKALESKQCNCK